MDRPLHIAFVATECVPFIKVGGLADVVGSLPKALEQTGVRADVVIPLEVADPALVPREVDRFPLTLRQETVIVSVHRTTLPGSGVGVWMLDGGGYFSRGGIYTDRETGSDYPDQLERWVFFQRAALELLARESPEVDIIHCHEHQTALIPAFLRYAADAQGPLAGTPTVLTIHNLGYQGIFPLDQQGLLQLPEALAHPGGPIEFYGQLNLMKCGILSADALTVVSPTYAGEIQTREFGYGLDGVVAERRDDLFGILNGIDSRDWDPEHDVRIDSRYSIDRLEGKEADRRALLRSFGLSESPREPVLAMVSRIDAHKGFDLVASVLDPLLGDGNCFTLLGTGDPAITRHLETITSAYPDRAGIRVTYDDTLARQVFAGADIFLMPSRYEPCGLTQMYALRYGTVPVVRATGGLADTIEEFDPATGRGNGFAFSAYDAGAFLGAIRRAIAAWRTPSWSTIVRNGMQCDFGWHTSVPRYLEVYAHAIDRRAGSHPVRPRD